MKTNILTFEEKIGNIKLDLHYASKEAVDNILLLLNADKHDIIAKVSLEEVTLDEEEYQNTTITTKV